VSGGVGDFGDHFGTTVGGVTIRIPVDTAKTLFSTE
jgi:hypothetical protein